MSNRTLFAINSQTIKASFLRLEAEQQENVTLNGQRILTLLDQPSFARFNMGPLSTMEDVNTPIIFDNMTPQDYVDVVGGNIRFLKTGTYLFYALYTVQNSAEVQISLDGFSVVLYTSDPSGILSTDFNHRNVTTLYPIFGTGVTITHFKAHALAVGNVELVGGTLTIQKIK